MTLRTVDPAQKIQAVMDVAAFGDELVVEDSVRTGEFVKVKQGVSLRPRNPRGVTINGGEILADGISGFEIGSFRMIGSPGYGGIIVFGPGKDFIIDRPFAQRCKQSGIAVWGTDQVRNPSHDPTDGRPGLENWQIIEPEIIDCCDGGSNEQITIAANAHKGLLYKPNVRDTGVASRQWGGEGIDIKIYCSDIDIVEPRIKTSKHPIYLDGAIARISGWKYGQVKNLARITVWDMLIEDSGDSVRFGTEGSGSCEDINFIRGVVRGTKNGKASLLAYLPPANARWPLRRADGSDIMPAAPKNCGIFGVRIENPSGRAIEANFPGIELDARDNSHAVSATAPVTRITKGIWPNPPAPPQPGAVTPTPPPQPPTPTIDVAAIKADLAKAKQAIASAEGRLP